MKDFSRTAEIAKKVKENISKVIVGNENAIELMLVAVMTKGHILLEDVPGMGKTLLAKSLAQSINCNFKRIQFTPDLLPSDITGIHFYNQKEGSFTFRAGPVFSNILLADEINRATPRTQSALLECMEEQQVTIDGETFLLENPFLVIATQNPVEIQGTFPLPEAQLDRFMMRLKLGYPKPTEGVEILKRFMEDSPLSSLTSVCGKPDILELSQEYPHIHVAPDLLSYIIQIAEATRQCADIALGVSPRGTQALLKASQAYALLHSRPYVTPDDIKTLAIPVLTHRLILKSSLRLKSGAAEELITGILNRIPVPTEDHLDF